MFGGFLVAFWWIFGRFLIGFWLSCLWMSDLVLIVFSFFIFWLVFVCSFYVKAYPRRFVILSAKVWLYSLFELSAHYAFDAILCLACAHHSVDDATLRFSGAHHTLVVDQCHSSTCRRFVLTCSLFLC